MIRSQRALAGAVATVALLALAAPPARAEGGALVIVPNRTTLVLLAVFVVLVPVVNRLLLAPLMGVLDERESRIEGARRRAAELAEQASALVARHDAAVREAREISNAEHARTVEEARRSQHATVAEARRLAEGEVAGARSRVAAAVESARGALRGEARALAGEMAERLLGRRLA